MNFCYNKLAAGRRCRLVLVFPRGLSRPGVMMHYRMCRWYDFYPRLAFALKLLALAPGALRRKFVRESRLLLDEQWDALYEEWSPPQPTLSGPGQRWYDADPEAARLVELLKNSPDSIKEDMTDVLLTFLSLKSA